MPVGVALTTAIVTGAGEVLAVKFPVGVYAAEIVWLPIASVLMLRLATPLPLRATVPRLPATVAVKLKLPVGVPVPLWVTTVAVIVVESPYAGPKFVAVTEVFVALDPPVELELEFAAR